MSTIKVAINGFGRIGRLALKVLLSRANFEVVAINDLADAGTLAHLLKFDSVHGKFNGTITAQKDSMVVNDSILYTFSEKDPSHLPWKKLHVDVVIESSGKFTSEETAGKHLLAGAKKVVISAPGKGNIPMIVMGVNDTILTGNERIISNASCTTNCLAPMVQIMDKEFGIEKGYFSTVHSYTIGQNIHDAPHADLRRTRAAAYSIIPTTTSAENALEKILPEVSGKLNGLAMRVPVPNGSLTDLTVYLKKETTVNDINRLFQKEAEKNYKGILSVTSDPIVSIDIIGNPHSCTIDSLLTACNGNMAKVVGWYDNETGYSNRLIDLIQKISYL